MGRLTVLGHVHLKGTDFHSKVSLKDIADAARRFGFETIHVTPHFRDPEQPQREPVVKFERLAATWYLPETVGGLYEDVDFELGVEANIVPLFTQAADFAVISGCALDAKAEDLADVYPVIASFHFTPQLGWEEKYKQHVLFQHPAWMTQGHIKVIDANSKWLTVIGHPYEYASELPSLEDFRRLCRVACQKGVALEIGVKRVLKIKNPDEDTLREKVWMLRPKYLDILIGTNVRLYIGTDIHHADQLRHLENLQYVAEYMVFEGIDPEQIVGWEEQP